MNNKKGFALYELLITYSLAFVVITSIFSTIATLSTKLAKMYKEDSIMASQLLVYKSIGDDFAYYAINNITKCVDLEGNEINNCAKITYEKNDSSIIEKTLLINNNYITYDDIKTEFKYGTVNTGNSALTNIDTSISSSYEDIPSNPNTEFFKRIIKLYIPISYEGKNYNITLFCTNAINNQTNFPINNLNGIFN